VTDASPASEEPAPRSVVLRASAANFALLSRASQLPVVSQRAVALARLYGRGALCRTIDGARWRFCWRHISTPLAGVRVRLQVGVTEVTVVLEDLGAFGSAVDVIRAELPPALRAAYLNGAGNALWRDLETLAERTLEVLEVEPYWTADRHPDWLGFEIQVESRGIAVRGLLQSAHTDLQDLLLKISSHGMAAAPLPAGLPIQWSAVVGGTRLTMGDVRALEEQDIIAIDDVTPAAEGLTCWLGVGPRRRRAGRLVLHRDGQFRMIEFTTKGQASMSVDVGALAAEQVGLDTIPVNLRFELARWEAPLAEVAGLAAGSIVDLGQRIDEQAVSIWVEQRCIGKGQLVAIGERLGVRLLSVSAPSS
jgi:type III secretion protein Q